jgi:uncharacterized SAM-binding protein YcdF (DUF218 family)
MPAYFRYFFRTLAWLCALAIAAALCLMIWGHSLLVVDDPLPAHVDAAVVLQGSIAAEKARVAGAIDLARSGVADRVLLSVPKESYWGQSVPPAARAYIERNFGSDLAARVDFCETGGEVNSTIEEMRAITPCIAQHHWTSVAIVTSDYHTRRARMIWRKASALDANMHVSVHGVSDPEFQQPWWRHRQSAKIFVMECVKLIWARLGG